MNEYVSGQFLHSILWKRSFFFSVDQMLGLAVVGADADAGAGWVVSASGTVKYIEYEYTIEIQARCKIQPSPRRNRLKIVEIP